MIAVSVRSRWRVWPSSLGREIAIILLVKAFLLWTLWACCFSDPMSARLDPGRVAASLIGNPPAPQLPGGAPSPNQLEDYSEEPSDAY